MTPSFVAVICNFKCEYEAHDRETFQAAGHFVHGGVKGPVVHCLTLKTQAGDQLLRVQADSVELAEEQMAQAIRDQLDASMRARSAQTLDYDTYLRLNNEINTLNLYIRRAYLWEIQHGRHLRFDTPVAAAIHYLHKERTRWSLLLRSLFRAKPHAEPDIDPDLARDFADRYDREH